MAENSGTEVTREQRYNAFAVNDEGDVYGRIEDVPLGNVLQFIQQHERPDEFPYMEPADEAATFKIEVLDR